MDAVVLVGGLGTRLRSLVTDVPKPMAPVNGVPFLDILLARLLDPEGSGGEIERVVLAVGYKRETVRAYFGAAAYGRPVAYAVELEPLGTGGGILNAIGCAQSDEVLVLNGDTLFEVDIAAMLTHHRQQKADLTLALKPMHDFDRYGTVETDGSRVVGFREKQYQDSGNINGGVYLLNRNLFDLLPEVMPKVFSFETDVLEKYHERLKVHSFISEGYFIDIGIPADYRRAQSELSLVG